VVAFSHSPSGKGAVIETPSVPGGIHGGDPGASAYLFFSVDDIEAAAARVRKLGGEAEEIPGDVESDESVARFGRCRVPFLPC
jgi:predicted enzyme related to lactoylglutathione lyase